MFEKEKTLFFQWYSWKVFCFHFFRKIIVEDRILASKRCIHEKPSAQKFFNIQCFLFFLYFSMKFFFEFFKFALNTSMYTDTCFLFDNFVKIYGKNKFNDWNLFVFSVKNTKNASIFANQIYLIFIEIKKEFFFTNFPIGSEITDFLW